MFMLWFLLPIVLLALLLSPVFLVARLGTLRRRIDKLEAELALLRVRFETLIPSAADVPTVAAPGAVEPVPSVAPATPPVTIPPVVLTPAVVEPWPPLPPDLRAPVAASVQAATIEPVAPQPAASTAPAAASVPETRSNNLEQLVGGLWMQNIGAVMLLLGIFLMIVWGYSTGRFGPEVLVVGGSLLGLALSWHGSRVARHTPRFGHALVGVGLGVVYLTLYVGYIRLHVLGPWLALALLVLVSLGAILTGLRSRVQAIAVFGVIGAFLPQFMARWLGMPGFEISPTFLLGYLAAIDLLVFALAARAGWSGLDVMAIVLSAVTWLTAFRSPEWGWNVQLGLSGLFTVLGLAPLPRLARVEGRLRPIDLAVVAGAPLAMIAASAQFLAYADRTPVAMLFFALAAITLGAALWVDLRRPERDLWVPLTAAATVYLAAALERATGPVYTALAWSIEGVALVLLGLRPRGGWLRLLGHTILFASACVVLLSVDLPRWTLDQWPVAHAGGIRDLLSILAILFVARGLSRSRERLSEFERFAPEFWTILGHLLLGVWLSSEADHIARLLTAPGSRLHPMPPPVGIDWSQRCDAIGSALAAAAWTVQATILAWRGLRGRRVLRLGGALLGLSAMLRLLITNDAWWSDQMAVAHPVSILHLVVVGLMVAIALGNAKHCERLPASERRWGDVWVTAAGLLLMLWSVRESRHLAIAIVRPDTLYGAALGDALRTRELALAATMASAAWLLQSVVLLVEGWRRGSSFLRWSGLVLIGVTLLKFVVFDLQTVDVFWRFVTAIVVGAAMLAFSYAYQRRSRAARASGTDPQ